MLEWRFEAFFLSFLVPLEMGLLQHLLLVAVTTCAVIGCRRRQSKGCGFRFFRFPAGGDRRRVWIAALKRQRAGGKPWSPLSGDRVCPAHFQTGQPSSDPSHIDYSPSLELGHGGDVRHRTSTCQRFERRSDRQVAKERRVAEAALAKQRTEKLGRTVALDHDYAIADCGSSLLQAVGPNPTVSAEV